jgi:hypothetical protein
VLWWLFLVWGWGRCDTQCFACCSLIGVGLAPCPEELSAYLPCLQSVLLNVLWGVIGFAV